MFADLTVDELNEARAAMMATDDDDYRLAPIWAAVEVRLHELDVDGGGLAAA